MFTDQGCKYFSYTWWKCKGYVPQLFCISWHWQNFIIIGTRKTKKNRVEIVMAAILAKYELLEKLKPDLQCYKCKDLPGPHRDQRKRYSCIDASHLLCEKDKAKCPCGSFVGTNPSTIIDKLLEGFPYKMCDNYAAGCCVIEMSTGDFQRHQRYCPFRLLSSSWAKISWVIWHLFTIMILKIFWGWQTFKNEEEPRRQSLGCFLDSLMFLGLKGHRIVCYRQYFINKFLTDEACDQDSKSLDKLQTGEFHIYYTLQTNYCYLIVVLELISPALKSMNIIFLSQV